MAKNPDKRASQPDLDEFGDHELAGAPSIAALIAALPEEQREAYRSERRAVLAGIRAAAGQRTRYMPVSEQTLVDGHPAIIGSALDLLIVIATFGLAWLWFAARSRATTYRVTTTRFAVETEKPPCTWREYFETNGR